MTKEEYIGQFIAGNHQGILYSYYLEKFNEKLHKPFLDMTNFMKAMIFFNTFDACMERVVKYYENKFDVVRVFQGGILIKMI